MLTIFFAFSTKARHFNDAMVKLNKIIRAIDTVLIQKQTFFNGRPNRLETEINIFNQEMAALSHYKMMLIDTRDLIQLHKDHSLFSVNQLSTMVAPLDSGEIDDFINRAKDFKDTNRNLYLSFLSLIVALSIGALVLSGLMLGGVVPATGAAFFSFFVIGIFTSIPSIAGLAMALHDTKKVEMMKVKINNQINSKDVYYENRENGVYSAETLMTFFSTSLNAKLSLKYKVLTNAKYKIEIENPSHPRIY